MVFVTLLFIIYYIFLYKPLVLPSFENRKITEKKLDTKELFESNFLPKLNNKELHAVTLVELRNGNMRAFWYAGSREGAKDVSKSCLSTKSGPSYFSNGS